MRITRSLACAVLSVTAMAVFGCSAASQPGADEPTATSTAEAQALGAKKGFGGFLDRMDQNKDQKVTADEAKAAAAAQFDKADTNRDGELDSAELASIIPAKRAMHAQKGRGLARLDRDGNGTISKDEAPPKLQARFEQVDTNHDGVLDQQELAAARPKKQGERGVAKIDANNDGKVSRAEYDEWVSKRFTRLDANRDGVISQDDRGAKRAPRHTR